MKKQHIVWTLFGLTLAALICSAFVGTQPVRAFSGCTPAECTARYNQAVSICQYHLGVEATLCGTDDDGGDFFYTCNDPNYFGLLECSTGGPS
jgi:hypothetical protein